LQAAAYYSHEQTLRLLLAAGADVNIQGGEYGNALQAAVASPSADIKIVGRLISADANVNAQGGKFGSALFAAAIKCYPPRPHGEEYSASGASSQVLVRAVPDSKADIIRHLLGAGAFANVGVTFLSQDDVSLARQVIGIALGQ
jgi:hypothetical protein